MKGCYLGRDCRGAKFRKFAKRLTNKARRKAAKHDPEGAGRRVRDFTTGWYS